MDTCSHEQVFQEILDEGLLLRGQVIENGVWWIFEIYSIAFSLRYIPPNIPEDPRFIKEIPGMVGFRFLFFLVFRASTLDPGFRV